MKTSLFQPCGHCCVFQICQIYIYIHNHKLWASLVAQMVKNLTAVWETQVWCLSREDPMEKEMATHSSILDWRIPWTVEPGGLQSMGPQSVGHDWATSLSLFNHTIGIRILRIIRTRASDAGRVLAILDLSFQLCGSASFTLALDSLCHRLGTWCLIFPDSHLYTFLLPPV